jgi:hypothetical protein
MHTLPASEKREEKGGRKRGEKGEEITGEKRKENKLNPMFSPFSFLL